MLSIIKNSITGFLSNSWTITLVATMLGVMAAIYLNGYFEEHSLIEDKRKALVEVEKELADNEAELQRYHKALKTKNAAFLYIFSIINEDMEIIVPFEEISNFQTQTVDFFELKDTTKLVNGLYKISGDLDFNIQSNLIFSPLSSVTWNTYKQTNYLSITSFDCLSDMELIYNIQEEVNTINKSWSNIFFKGNYIADSAVRDEFLALWKNLLMHQELLFDLYNTREETLQPCY